jgi:hypothetical protein
VIYKNYSLYWYISILALEKNNNLFWATNRRIITYSFYIKSLDVQTFYDTAIPICTKITPLSHPFRCLAIIICHAYTVHGIAVANNAWQMLCSYFVINFVYKEPSKTLNVSKHMINNINKVRRCSMHATPHDPATKP